MRLSTLLILATLATAAACSSDNHNGTDGGNNADGSNTNGDGSNVSGTAGTCASPVVLNDVAMKSGTTWTYNGSTANGMNALHPYGQPENGDSTESVLRLMVPAGFSNMKISTEGSDFDTQVYVRTACSQIAGGADIGYGDDTEVADPMAEPATSTTMYLTGLTEGQVIFLVVDGKAMGEPTSGTFRLTVEPFTPGTSGNPCAMDTEGNGTCMMSTQACGPAQRCVNTVAAGAMCDQRGVSNTCVAGTSCVNDPSPANAEMNPMVCAAPGTRAGAPCRDAASVMRCDTGLQCNGAADAPICVRVLEAGAICDPMGLTNRCPIGRTCRTTMAGSTCEL